MQLVERFATVFAFRTLPTTFLALLLYAVVFGAVLFGDIVPKVPKDQKGLDLTEAYADLHQIAGRPHPFLSHANDLARAYIVDRVRNITDGVEYIEVEEDLQSNTSFSTWGRPASTYNEGTNILVKINGTDPEYTTGGGVLFSAHYDSVSTASGVTDDGMGVATLIQLVKYFAKNRPKRTAVFNINNGEEDGLNGAFTYLVHPWSKLTDVFLNLEGASSGGRPLLFRGTSTPALRSFHVPHPHGNVLSSDAFSRGMIRSGTDYTAYTGVGMEGLDLAFYRGRSKYHTKYDAIPYTEGLERALWAMMEAAKSSGIALLNDDRTHGTGSPPVYFDLFGIWLVLLSMNTLFISNIVLVVVGPILLVTLTFIDAAIAYGRNQHQNGHVPENRDSLLQQFWSWFIEFGWLKGIWSWAKFWIAVLVTLGLQAALMYGYAHLNPFIIYSDPTLVVVSSFTLTYLSLVFVVTPRSNHLPERQKHIMFVQTYIFTWILLVASTVAVDSGIGGTYFVTAWNAAVLIACMIGSVENMLGAQGSYEVPHRFFRRARYDAVPQLEAESSSQAVEAEAQATEATPLIQSSSPPTSAKDESGAIGWWILQLALAVSVPVTLVAHIAILVIGATAQTLADGNSPIGVYGSVSILVFMLVLPIVPFTFKIHSAVTFIFIVVFVLSTAYNLIAFPFSQTEPLKVYFEQNIDLGNFTAPLHEVTHATTALLGAPHFMKDLIIPQIPSAIGQEVNCTTETALRGLQRCTWESTLLPDPGSYPLGAPGPWPPRGPGSGKPTTFKWMTASVLRLKPKSGNSARFTISAKNTRGCRLYLDNQRITRWKVHHLPFGKPQEFEAQAGGVSILLLYGRTWDRAFVVDVDWEGSAELEGRVSCDWAEYESGSVGVDTTAKIPALEEMLTFLPKWTAVTQYGSPVKATGTFYLA
ncbi:hypothetical protein B0H16DRAFT_1522499 [Mycena metata]|uniref:Peptide hydrolase n=1 Tax=Mycena metata TaxID=1033252 RepID=A0AAD7NMH7_9AGAR|nr:hypothetical protein B0H16DRAFT_1522499 [Mycena metata]